MAINKSKACPKCREMGHDKDGSHLLIFPDGNGYCSHSHWHKSGQPYFEKKGKGKPVFEDNITGMVKYSPDEFLELFNAKKLKDPFVRELALGGMKEQDKYAVMFEEERYEMEQKWELEVAHFNKLPVKNLVSRGIKGEIAKLYNVKVGADDKGKVARHYYPAYSLETGDLQGAKCRNLPKNFMTGRLGKVWGKTKLFGQNTMKEVSASKARKDILLITGGECDAMAAQQMLHESREGTQWENQWFHVWSVMKGESGIGELVDNIKAIKKFKKIIFCFDNDKAGIELSKKACRLLREKSVVLTLPDGCKDPNDCLVEGRDAEFVDAWWKAEKPQISQIKGVEELFKEATAEVEMGLSFPWATVTEQTFGIRPHNMYTIGGGSGVGKTEIAKEVISHLVDFHRELVGVIFMEERASYTLRVLAGKWINKKIHLPKNNHPKSDDRWDKGRDYTTEEATGAINNLMAKGKLLIAECDGDTSIDNIIALTEELRAMGCKYIFIDNLTTITHDESMSEVKGIDKSMKRLGTYMQEEPVSIFLLSHLAKPDQNRTPFEAGGQVRQSDFRGSQSIAFWSTFMLAVERNTEGNSEEKTVTTLRCVKDRLTGMSTGQTSQLYGNTKTGRLLEAGSNARKEKDITPKKRHKKSKKHKPTDDY